MPGKMARSVSYHPRNMPDLQSRFQEQRSDLPLQPVENYLRGRHHLHRPSEHGQAGTPSPRTVQPETQERLLPQDQKGGLPWTPTQAHHSLRALTARLGTVTSTPSVWRLGPGSATEGSLPVLGSLLIDLGRETMNSP